MPDWTPARIRLLRVERGLTQEQAARRTGVSYTTWNRWENGHIRPASHRAIVALEEMASEPPSREASR
jgi:transcriptional regulator with XRE-family HTH domain